MNAYRVLLIDDNEIDNYISNHVLEETKLAKEITTKNSAIDALSYLKNLELADGQFPDIIFLDVRMPKMDGFEFLEEFKTFTENKTLACSIIMLTSSLYPDDKARAMQNPFVKKFLNKPLTSEIVEELLKF